MSGIAPIQSLLEMLSKLLIPIFDRDSLMGKDDLMTLGGQGNKVIRI